ncbi:MAG: hypothetical protein K0Q83_2497 [Deltaproteobacteria bacterium]|jgi:hypothetical protein|nr:hypothetical protein [Deltaproteobacteria bacterium]
MHGLCFLVSEDILDVQPSDKYQQRRRKRRCYYDTHAASQYSQEYLRADRERRRQ